MSTVVVVGGGISGLSAAYYLTKTANAKISKVILLEGSKRLGGWVNTTRFEDGSLFEHGPRSLRPANKQGFNTLKLVEELGLSEDVIAVPRSHAAAKNRLIYVNDKLHMLPNGLIPLFKKKSPFSKPLIHSLATEVFRPKSALQDECIHSFMERRLGKEFAEYAFSAVCRGIFAGDTKQLSVKSCFPDFYDMEKKYGSITAGMIMKPKAKQNYESKLEEIARKEKWASWSLKNGLQQIIERMNDVLISERKVDIRLHSPCRKISFKERKAIIETDAESIEADHVICSQYSKYLANCLPQEHSAMSTQLSSIPSVTCLVVNVEFEESLSIPEAFGHLLPPFENGPILGVVYDSCVFPSHSRPDKPSTRVTMMLGGSWFEDLKVVLGGLDETVVTKFVCDALRRQLNINSKPSKVLINLQEDCIPQYVVGHSQVLETIFAYIDSHKLPLTLVGSSYKGPAINDCIYNARLGAEDILRKYG